MSSKQCRLRVMGVPEAFNLPVMKSGSVDFVSAPGGTGAMLAALQQHPQLADVSLALTECVVAAIENGSPVRILGPYIASPLKWAICVRPKAEKAELSLAKWGVSRLGSGSHIMVSVLAKQRGWKTPQFQVCDDFRNLRAALSEGRIDAFLWEKYTTRPFEIAGDLSFAGEVVTPWGCFCAVVAYPPRLDTALARQALQAVLEESVPFQEDSDGTSVEQITAMSGMTTADATEWHRAVRYAKVGQVMSQDDLRLARETLAAAGVIEESRFSSEHEYCIAD